MQPDIEGKRCRRVWQGGLAQPLPDSSMVLFQVTALPDELRESFGEVNGMLPGATANFQYRAAVDQQPFKY